MPEIERTAAASGPQVEEEREPAGGNESGDERPLDDAELQQIVGGELASDKPASWDKPPEVSSSGLGE